ncbi:MAG: hypothetical protein PGN11_06230 [Quadrisphaera sp.]
MKITRLLTPATTGAALVAAALALAPAASATGHRTSTSSRSSTLPAASKVFPTPGKQVTVTPGSTSTSPSGASLDWTIPACRGTVFASFLLKQGSSVYLHERGSATAYPFQPTPQTVTVTYSPADPSQGPLSAGPVRVTTATKAAATGSKTYKARTSTVTAVLGRAADPDPATLPIAAHVIPVPAAEQVTVVPTGTTPFPTSATLDWTLPACRGTVYAYFQLDQDQPYGTQTYVQEKGMNAYPCASTPQTLHVKYHGVDPSARALVAGQVELTMKTYGSATNWQNLGMSDSYLPAVLSTQGS